MKNCIFICLIFCINFNYAQLISTDRPSAQTDNSYSLYHKAFQIESGLIYSSVNDEIQNSSVPNLLFRYGLLDRLELRFSTNLLHTTIEKEFIISPLQFGTKIQLLREEKYQVAFLSMYSFNEQASEVLTKIVGGYSISDNFNIGYTFGYLSAKKFVDKSLNYSIFLSNSFNDKISAFLEFYGNTKYNLETPINQLNFDLGASYLITNKMQVDAYFGTGLNNDMYFGSIGFSYLFNKF